MVTPWIAGLSSSCSILPFTKMMSPMMQILMKMWRKPKKVSRCKKP